jgi:hypothetical protein
MRGAQQLPIGEEEVVEFNATGSLPFMRGETESVESTKSVFGSSRGSSSAGRHSDAGTIRTRDKSSPLAISVSRQLRRVRICSLVESRIIWHANCYLRSPLSSGQTWPLW